MAKQKSDRNRKIGFTILAVTIATILLAFFSGGAELGGLKLPSLGKNIIANVDVERTFTDVGIVKTTIDIHQGFFSVGAFSLFLPDSETFIGTKKLTLKMSVRGQLCDSKEFEIEGRGVKNIKLNCGSPPVGQGDNYVLIELFDTKGKEDIYETTFLVK